MTAVGKVPIIGMKDCCWLRPQSGTNLWIVETIPSVMLSSVKHLGKKRGALHPRPFARQVGTQGDNVMALGF